MKKRLLVAGIIVGVILVVVGVIFLNGYLSTEVHAYAVQVDSHYEVVVYQRHGYGPWESVQCDYRASQQPSDEELLRLAKKYL